jgi:glucosamine--fructose-6-phosphate aminotransferase (isomerizing)
MCGIMAYVGGRPAKDVIYPGLKRLEYRGYDSAGIALLDDSIITTKALGATDNIDLTSITSTARVGIGHTRWATHGKPSVANAHPHTFGRVTLVHNGIIENYEELKGELDSLKLVSQTDSEVLAGLIDSYFVGKVSLLEATKLALAEVKGTFGIAVISADEPGQIITARRGSPIVVGVGDGQYYIASDSSAIVDHTDKVIYLEDDQIAVVKSDSLGLYDLKLNHQEVRMEKLGKSDQDLGHTGFESFLDKEIHEQPDTIEDVMRGRVGSDGSIKLGGPNLSQAEILRLKHIVIIGCGTAYYAGYYAKYELEQLLGLQVRVEFASEFRYRYGSYDPPSTLAIFMSQSGETADTLASLREAKRRGIKTLGIINTVGSTIAREVDHGGIYLHAGVESSVASTKAYSSMVVALLMLGGVLNYHRGGAEEKTRNLAYELLRLPDEIRATLKLNQQVDKVAGKLGRHHDWFFLGRGNLYPVALEGALKVTEVAYVHAQAFPAGEMKHGPIALVDSRHLSVLLLPEDDLLYKKSLSALEELKARGGKVMTVSTRPKESLSDYHIEIAHSGSSTDGLIYNVCLQLLALAVANQKNVNVDRPRNLAKSVTVE